MLDLAEGSKIDEIDCAYYSHHDGPAARAR